MNDFIQQHSRWWCQMPKLYIYPGIQLVWYFGYYHLHIDFSMRAQVGLLLLNSVRWTFDLHQHFQSQEWTQSCSCRCEFRYNIPLGKETFTTCFCGHTPLLCYGAITHTAVSLRSGLFFNKTPSQAIIQMIRKKFCLSLDSWIQIHVSLMNSIHPQSTTWHSLNYKLSSCLYELTHICVLHFFKWKYQCNTGSCSLFNSSSQLGSHQGMEYRTDYFFNTIFIICVANFQPELLKYIDTAQLPAYLGGELTDPDGNPRCVTMVSLYHFSDC